MDPGRPLSEVLTAISQLDPDAILCVQHPWTGSAPCCVTRPDSNLGVPNTVRDAGYAYFLEVGVAREILEGSIRKLTPEERLDLLLYYAEHDAFPVWVQD